MKANVFMSIVPYSRRVMRCTGVLCAALLAFLLGWGIPAQAQSPDAGPVIQVEISPPADGVSTANSLQTAEPEAVARMAAGLDTVVSANSNPQALAAAIADFVAEACLSGNCAAATRAALNLAAATASFEAPANPTALAIGSALAQVVSATREIRPEIAQAIASEIANPPSGAGEAVISFNAVASIKVDEVVSTATIGTPGSGA